MKSNLIQPRKLRKGLDLRQLRTFVIMLLMLPMPLSKEEIKFKWKDRHDNFIKPKDMSPKHLFYTWLMIWNHSAPPFYQHPWGNRYVFDAFYTNEYMNQAFHVIYSEMKKRTGYGYKTLSVIKEIEDFLSDHPELNDIKIR